MARPDFSKMFPKKLVTISMADKYMAVCFLYDGVQYQNLCSEEGSDGSNNSEQCLRKITSNLPFIGYEPDGSTTNESANALVPYGQEQSEFPDIVSAISHYWKEVLFLCLLSALLFHIFFVLLRRRSTFYHGLFHFYTGYKFFNPRQPARLSAGPTVDKLGTISIGKISFDPKVVLGLGSKGTCVFKGSFEGSTSCAVKRIVSQYMTIADREVEFLRSLQHPNLVRYLATEEDAQFIYIALELAEFTLGDLIETNRTDEIGISKEELCRQSALGLQHLHKLNIVHRDIKPQNILISFPNKANNERKVMISDFGLSKELSNLESGHTSSAMRYFDGTQGWMAPEIVNAKLSEDKSLLPTKSADIFSLGCVFYYILSDGQHPFGKMDQRQANILNNIHQLDLFSMRAQDNVLKVDEDKAIMASILIKAMIQSSPQNRPPINSILKYPFFWCKSDQLQFLLDVSDRVDKLERDDEVLKSVERNRQKIFAFGWIDCLTSDLQEDLNRHRKYNTRWVCHLLRAIRNKKHHYRELPVELKSSLGEVPDDYMNYFSSRFPELLPHIYQAMQKCKEEPEFKSYYEQFEDFEFN